MIVATSNYDVTVMAGEAGEQLLRLVKLYVRAHDGNKRTIFQVTALLHSGSSMTILREEVARQLGARLNFEDVAVTTLHETNTEKMASLKLQVSPYCKEWHDVNQAKTSTKFSFGDTQLQWSDHVKQDPVFKGVDVGDYNYNEIDLLVGRNVELLFLPLHGKENVRVDKNGILAVNTKLGWTIAGPLKTTAMAARYSCKITIVNASTIVTSNKEEVSVAVKLRRLNDVDALGIEPKKMEMSRKEEREQAALDRTMFWKDGKITIQMSWKGEFKYVPPSKAAARKRLQLLHKKLSKATPAVRSEYAKTISNDVKKSYVKKLSKEEAEQLQQGFHWFLPHFIVFHPDKPDCPRCVLDCAAKVDGISLNSMLNAGPVNMASMIGVLMRFRAHKYIINTDIKEMFLQFPVYEKDRDFLAFLWHEDPKEEPDVYVNTRHVFGATCSPSIATHGATEAVRRVNPQLVPVVKRSVYVDDYYDGGKVPDEVVSQFVDVRDAMKQSSLHLGKVMSNSKEILAKLSDKEKTPKFRDIDAKDNQSLPSTKALGLRWDCEEDVFCFSTRAEAKKPNNVGDVLSQLASTYDPLQTIGPYLMTGKLLLQQFWQEVEDWKKPLNEEQQQWWLEWMTGLADIEDLRVPRWYGFPRGTVVTLSSCSDASDTGYGASSHFHAPGYETAFVAAKGKVIGKKLSTPRSELQALVVSCRLTKTILKETEEVVNIGKIVFWVDSTAVYFWVKNEKNRYVPFVANRLAEIHDILDELKQYQPEVCYVNTTENPADLLTRVRTVDKFKEQFNFWVKGPRFFMGGVETWPTGPDVPENEKELELKKVFVTLNAAVVSDAVDEDVTTSNGLVKYAEKKGYSDVTVDQLEKKIVKEAQQAVFAKDIAELVALPQPSEEGVLKSKIFTTGQLPRKEVFLDSKGLLRTVTRLDNASFASPDKKRPLLLPSKHPLMQLLVPEYYRQAAHCGPKTMFALIAKRYSLPLSAVKNVTYKCQHCRKRTPIPIKYPQAALHENRLQAWT
jgi:hypothetical protein